jgi:hypothetical protein
MVLEYMLAANTNSDQPAVLHYTGSVIKVSVGSDPRLCTDLTACYEYLVRESCQMA